LNGFPLNLEKYFRGMLCRKPKNKADNELSKLNSNKKKSDIGPDQSPIIFVISLVTCLEKGLKVISPVNICGPLVLKGLRLRSHIYFSANNEESQPCWHGQGFGLTFLFIRFIFQQAMKIRNPLDMVKVSISYFSNDNWRMTLSSLNKVNVSAMFGAYPSHPQ